MPFQLSPGVAVVEKDFSSIMPAVSSSAGAYCGPFAWGPIEDPVRVSSETDLVARFGKPTDSNFQAFFTAVNFLAYANNLLVTRTDAEGLRNAVAQKSGSVQQTYVQLTDAGSGYVQGADTPVVTFSAPTLEGGITATGTVVTETEVVGEVTQLRITGITVTDGGSGYVTPPTVTISAPAAGESGRAQAIVTQVPQAGVKIKNITNYLDAFADGQGVNGMFAAKFAGTKANGVSVMVVDAGNWNQLTATQKTYFPGAPGTSIFAASEGITNDEIHIAVFDNDKGSFSGVAGSMLEKYSFLSKLSDAKRPDGTNNYYKNVINSQSRYIWWLDHASDSQVSEPTSVDVVNNTTGAAATFSTSRSITIPLTGISDPQYAFLNAFRTYFTSKPAGELRQIAITNTANNNGIFTVTGVTFTIVSGETTGAVITVSEPIAAESASAAMITSVSKATWGVTAEVAKATAGSNTFKILKGGLTLTLDGGADDFGSTAGQIQTAYAALTNADQYDISLVLTGNVSGTTARFIVDNLCEVRKDCIAFISPNANGEPITATGSDATDAIIAYRQAGTSDLSSSYAVIDSGFKYQYDRYNDAYRWVPLNGDIAGLCARTDYTADPWYSPGGFNRGQIKNVVKLAFNPSQSDRDVLYAAGVNPVVSFPGQGVVLYGDKTMLAKPSAFDRINVRRLFIVLEKAIATAAKYQLFEFNDSFTRAQFKNLVEPFLRDVQGRRGVTDFRVKCDEVNNTGEVIDRNEFVADIFIKPSRSINFITLNFVAARTSVSFEEIGG
jgi:phage tail sheath protein FI